MKLSDKVAGLLSQNKWIVIFLGVLIILNLRIVANTFYFDLEGSICSTVEGYGDLPLHLSQISKFAYGTFDLNEPIYFGSQLQYPFLFNFIRGILLLITKSWSIAVLWPLLILIIANIILTFLIYFCLTKNKILAYLSTIVFFLGSGLHWYYEFFKSKGVSTFYLDLQYPFQNISYGPTMISIVHQHTFHFGLFLFLIFVYCIIKYSFANKWANIVSLIALVLLPISHIHSFVAASLFLIIYFIYQISKKDFVLAKKSFIIGVVGLFLSIPELYFLLKGRVGEGFGHFRLGWMIEAGFGSANFHSSLHSIFSLDYLNFVWINFGLIIPLFILALVYFRKIKKMDIDFAKPKVSIFLFTGLAIFIIANLYQFQPWDYDNNKLIIYALFFASIVIMFAIFHLLLHFFGNKKTVYSILILITIFISLSGSIDLYRRFTIDRENLNVVFDRNALEMAQFIIENTDKTKTILSSDNHRNPAISLAGRQGLMGYDGWLWSRGIAYADRKEEVQKFFRNPEENLGIFSKYNIGYILVDNKIEEMAPKSIRYFDQNFEKMKQLQEYILYKTK